MFVKVHGKILNSSIWLESKETKLVWLTMLIMADASGVVEASVGGLAHRAGVTRDECEAALEVLRSPDMDSSDGTSGERIESVPGGWFVINHANYRDRRTHQQVETAKRVQKHRDKKKSMETGPKGAQKSKALHVTNVTSVTGGNAISPQKQRQRQRLTGGGGGDPVNVKGSRGADAPPRGSRLWSGYKRRLADRGHLMPPYDRPRAQELGEFLDANQATDDQIGGFLDSFFESEYAKSQGWQLRILAQDRQKHWAALSVGQKTEAEIEAEAAWAEFHELEKQSKTLSGQERSDFTDRVFAAHARAEALQKAIPAPQSPRKRAGGRG